MMLSTISWTGAGRNNLWSNVANWSSKRLPGANDDVTIGRYAVVDNVSATIDSLQCGGSLTIESGATLSLGSQSLTSSLGSLQIQVGATFTEAGGLTINGAIVNNGTLDTTNATLNGPLTTSPGSTIQITGGTLSVANGFTNYGTIQLPGAANAWPDLAVNGNLVNAAGAAISCQGDSINVSVAEIDAQVTNLGTITVTTCSLTVNPIWVSDSYNSASRFDNTGTVNLNDGYLCVGGEFDPSVGVIDGTGALGFQGTTVDLSNNWTPEVVVCLAADVTVAGPGTLTISAGNGVAVFGATVNTPVDVNSQGLLWAMGSTDAPNSEASTISGPLTMAPGSTLLVGLDATRCQLALQHLRFADVDPGANRRESHDRQRLQQ